MIDDKKRKPGKYKDEYSDVIDGFEVNIVEEIVIGRDYEILNFSRSYTPPLPYVCKNGVFTNVYNTKDKGKNIEVTEITLIIDEKVVGFDKVIVEK